jgi:hypothetical protein
MEREDISSLQSELEGFAKKGISEHMTSMKVRSHQILRFSGIIAIVVLVIIIGLCFYQIIHTLTPGLSQ